MKRNRRPRPLLDSTRRQRTRRRRGATVVLVVLMLAAFLATAALSVDVAYMHLVNSQLRASTDAAAMAAVEVLGRNQNATAARNAAKYVALTNQVSGQGVILTDGDIVLGRSRFQADDSVSFTPGQMPFNAARVTGRKEKSSPSGASPLFFARIFGMNDWGTRQVATAARWERDICLVVDRSNSMNFENKLPDLREAVSIFIDVLENDGYLDKVGLASYNHISRLDQNLTYDMNRIRLAMSRISADGQTNIGGGIITGQSALMGSYGRTYTEKTMILMTDGKHNTGYDPLLAARLAADQGIVIHTITFSEDTDRELMEQVADITGGHAYHAPDGETLKEIYRKIAMTFGTVLTE
ncbi:MAG: VWA domain-containing protein [Planctomycetes bacterium]|nr:VWA domain-containing protein [Planctomycetota bacterium]